MPTALFVVRIPEAGHEYFARAPWRPIRIPHHRATLSTASASVKSGPRWPRGEPGNVTLAMTHVVPDLVQKILKGQDPLAHPRQRRPGAALHLRGRPGPGDLDPHRATKAEQRRLGPLDRRVHDGARAGESGLEKMTAPDVPLAHGVSDTAFEYDVAERVPGPQGPRRPGFRGHHDPRRDAQQGHPGRRKRGQRWQALTCSLWSINPDGKPAGVRVRRCCARPTCPSPPRRPSPPSSAPAAEIPGVRAFHRRRPRGHAPRPGGRRRRARAVDRHPGAQRGAHHRRLRRVVPRGPRDAGVVGEILIVDSSHRPHARARARRRRPGAAHAQARPRAGPTSTPSPTSAAATWSWATPTAPTTSASSRRSSRSSARATSTSWARAGRAPSSRGRCRRCTATSARRSRPGSSTGSTRSQLLRHPLRHAGHHPRRAGAHGPAVPVVGVRVGDGAEVGAHGAAHRRGAGPLPQGPRGPAQPPQAPGWFSPFAAAWINLRAMFVYGADFFLVQAGLALLAARAAADAAADASATSTIGPITFSLHWQFLGVDAGRGRPAELLLGLPAAGASSTTPAGTASAGVGCFPYTRRCSPSAGSSRSGVVLARPARRDLRPQRPRARGATTPSRTTWRVTGLAARDHRASCTFVLHAAAARDATSRARARADDDDRRRASTSFGQHGGATPVDRFGVWLSAARDPAPRRRRSPGKRLGDFGCGFDARFTRTQLAERRAAPCSSTSRSPTTSRRTPRSRAHRGHAPRRAAQRRRRRRSTSRSASRCSSTSGTRRAAAPSCAACCAPGGACAGERAVVARASAPSSCRRSGSA